MSGWNEPTHLPKPLKERPRRDEDEAYDEERQRKVDEEAEEAK